MGVRISWLMLAKNWLLASDAFCAASLACTSSVTSMRKPTMWPSGSRRSTMRTVRPLASSCTSVVLPDRCAATRSATQASTRPTASG